MSKFHTFTFICMGFLAALPVAAQSAFVNFETPQVHPLDINFDGSLLVACNTADNRIEVYSLESGEPVHVGAVPVGLDPVTVRFYTNTQVWVVNQISDSISIVELDTLSLTNTIETMDKPSDVVFSLERAFISCSSADTVQVFSAITHALLANIPIDGEEPKALAVSPDQNRVYCAIFESGNKSTVINGSRNLDENNAVSDPIGPYMGVNPPPNNGNTYDPPIAVSDPPLVSQILKKNDLDQWMDDNGANWTDLVSGANADKTRRIPGWDLLDNDVAVIDVTDLVVTDYIEGLMNICMGIATNPATGDITVVGLDATNEIRFEPNVNGTFIRVMLGITSSDNFSSPDVVDLNNHLTYTTSTLINQVDRDLAIGDPRGIAWNGDGSRGYITGMGSNNVVVIDANGDRINAIPTEVAEGPVGLIVDDERNRLYVLNRFEASLSVINTESDTEISQIPFFDPTPNVIKVGRKHLYDTHKTSGLGTASCASCHIDSRMDRLAWDLGAPDQESFPVSNATHNLGSSLPFLSAGFEDNHAMKGPMITQTLQDIIGMEPFHWRGDRAGLEDFNAAFMGLLGDDVLLTDPEMQEFKDFLSTIHFPPNPFRNFDNSLPTSVDLPHNFASGEFALPRGAALPPGNAERGLRIYTGVEIGRTDGNLFNCITCHSLPTGVGTNSRWNGSSFQEIPLDKNGNKHIMMVSVDSSDNKTIKVPQTRNVFDKAGMDFSHSPSRTGFGYFHDGTVDSVASFFSSALFDMTSDQDVADVSALMFAFPGSQFGNPPTSPALGLPVSPPSSVLSKDAHAAVGKQVTLLALTPPAEDTQRVNDSVALAQAGKVDLVARGTLNGDFRSFLLEASDTRGGPAIFQTDSRSETISLNALLDLPFPTRALTFTVVPAGTGVRIALDRDSDTVYDYDEILAGTDPSDPSDFPSLCEQFDDIEAQYNTLFTAFSLYADIDGDELPEIASFALVEAIACGTLESNDYASATNAAYIANLNAFDNESDTGTASPYREAIAVLMLISSDTQFALTDLLADGGVNLTEDYQVVTCSDPETCLPDETRNTTRAANEPYSGAGNPDQDASTNAEEYASIVTVGGGTLLQFAASALGGSASSGGGGGGGSCLIATASYGTPLAQELDTIRTWRNTYLLNNAAGTMLSDMYYRVSNSIAGITEQSVLLTNIIRFATTITLFTIQHSLVILLSIGTMGLAMRRLHKRVQL